MSLFDRRHLEGQLRGAKASRDAWKARYFELNEELAGLDSVNQSLIGRCLELEIENGRLSREIQEANDQGTSSDSFILERVGDGSDDAWRTDPFPQ
jgi:hypothetical protein